VTINYRLSTLGFFAVPGTNITGNYGIQDQITALQWTINNIAAFGGNASQITIIGSSAGGGSVRVLLGSPPAIGKFQGGIAQSNLGGGVGLGHSGNYATTYSSYLTIQEGYDLAGTQIFSGAGCNQTTIDAQITCLEQYDAVKLNGLPIIADKVVQVSYHRSNTEAQADRGLSRMAPLSIRNNLSSLSRTAAQPMCRSYSVSVAQELPIWGLEANAEFAGTAENDGASFSTYPKGKNITSLLQGIELELGIEQQYAQAIIDSGLFPYYDTGNLTLDSFNVSQRVATDNQFRCVDEATVYAGATTGAFEVRLLILLTHHHFPLDASLRTPIE
jgi:hypothetical protein